MPRILDLWIKVDASDTANMPGPLPEGLRMGMYEAYGYCSAYGEFMRRVVALQEGTMSLEVADNDVFGILGYDGGWTDRYHVQPQRDASSKSHRPDLYRMFVEWSAAAPPAPGVDINAPVPGPEAMRPEVWQELVLHEVACHRKALEQLADKVHHMEMRWSCTYLDPTSHKRTMFPRVDTKMAPNPDKVTTTTAPGRVVGNWTAGFFGAQGPPTAQPMNFGGFGNASSGSGV